MNNQNWNFQNSYIGLPSKLYIKQSPISVKIPQIIYLNKQLAKELGIESLSKDTVAITEYLHKPMLDISLDILPC